MGLAYDRQKRGEDRPGFGLTWGWWPGPVSGSIRFVSECGKLLFPSARGWAGSLGNNRLG